MSLEVGDINDEDYNPSIHEFHSVLLSAKAQVSPLRIGLTVPRSELSGLCLATRLQLRIARNYQPGLASSHTLCDSTFVIASSDKNSTQFSPFFH